MGRIAVQVGQGFGEVHSGEGGSTVKATTRGSRRQRGRRQRGR